MVRNYTKCINTVPEMRARKKKFGQVKNLCHWPKNVDIFFMKTKTKNSIYSQPFY